MKCCLLALALVMNLPLVAQSKYQQLYADYYFDDAEFESGVVDVYDTDLDVGWDSTGICIAVVRFNDVLTHKGSLLDSAKLRLLVEPPLQSPFSLLVYFEQNPWSEAFSNDEDFRNRNWSNSAFVWELPANSGNLLYSPDISAYINNLIIHSDWALYSDISIMLEPANTAYDPSSAVNKIELLSSYVNDVIAKPNLFLYGTDFATGTPKADSDKAPKPYPNPAQNQLCVGTKGPWQLMNSLGQAVFESSAECDQLPPLPSGPYTVVYADGRHCGVVIEP